MNVLLPYQGPRRFHLFQEPLSFMSSVLEGPVVLQCDLFWHRVRHEYCELFRSLSFKPTRVTTAFVTTSMIVYHVFLAERSVTVPVSQENPLLPTTIAVAIGPSGKGRGLGTYRRVSIKSAIERTPERARVSSRVKD
jgi:hypothetical protein